MRATQATWGTLFTFYPLNCLLATTRESRAWLPARRAYPATPPITDSSVPAADALRRNCRILAQFLELSQGFSSLISSHHTFE